MIKMEQAMSSITVIAPQCDALNAGNAARFKQSVLQLIEDGHSRLVVDLGQVDSVDSTAIGALVGVMKRIGLRGDMVLCGLSDKVARNFRLTRMDKVFPIHSDSDGALRALAA